MSETLYFVLGDKVINYPEPTFEPLPPDSLLITIVLNSAGVENVEYEWRHNSNLHTFTIIGAYINGTMIPEYLRGGSGDVYQRLFAGFEFLKAGDTYHQTMDIIRESFPDSVASDWDIFRDWMLFSVASVHAALYLSRTREEEVGRPFDPYTIRPIVTTASGIDIVTVAALEAFHYYSMSAELMTHLSPGMCLLRVISLLRTKLHFFLETNGLLPTDKYTRDSSIVELLRSVQRTSADMLITASGLYSRAQELMSSVASNKNIIEASVDKISEGADSRLGMMLESLQETQENVLAGVREEGSRVLDNIRDLDMVTTENLKHLAGSSAIQSMVEDIREQELTEAENHLSTIAKECANARETMKNAFVRDISAMIEESREHVIARGTAMVSTIEDDLRERAFAVTDALDKTTQEVTRMIEDARALDRSITTSRNKFEVEVRDFGEELNVKKEVLGALQRGQETLARQFGNAAHTTKMLDAHTRNFNRIRGELSVAENSYDDLRNETRKELGDLRDETVKTFIEMIDRLEEKIRVTEARCQETMRYCKRLENRAYDAAEKADVNTLRKHIDEKLLGVDDKIRIVEERLQTSIQGSEYLGSDPGTPRGVQKYDPYEGEEAVEANVYQGVDVSNYPGLPTLRNL